jgi:DNA-binding IclR family transcriptional regulator
LPKATVSRLTYTLAKLGYLVYMKDTGQYRMGVPVLGLGYACLGGLKIRETAQPYMQEFADHAGDGALVAMGGRDDLSIIYVACARSEGVISLQLGVGSRVSLGRSSIGWAYLAACPDSERESLLRRLRAKAGKEKWGKIAEGIAHATEQVKAQGFCLNDGEWHPQIASVAVPFRSSHPDVPTLAFNCGGPSSILSPQRLKKDLGPKLVEMASKIAAIGTVY